MNINEFFPYSWFVDDSETEITSIRVYGIGTNNENICLRITDFTPYIYLELPSHIPWNDMKAQMIGNKLDEMMGKQKPLKKCLIYKYKLYGANLNEDGTRKKYPFLFCSFSTRNDIRKLSYDIQKKNLIVPGLGAIKLKMHEQDADPILQLTVAKDLPTAGWIKFSGQLVKSEDDKITLCDLEYKVKWKNMTRIEKQTVGLPKIMGFDIEVNSSNPSSMPKVEKPEDKIFQISCVFAREGSKIHTPYLLTLGNPIQELVGENVKILRFLTEADLLIGFTELIRTENPNIIVGYNILSFDIPYMIDRSKRPCRVNHVFDTLGFHKYNHAKEKIIKWSSSAYKNQEFKYLDGEGRLFVDLLPLVKRDFKMDNYRLKTVSDYFLGQTKDDLSVKGIFKCYRIGTKKELDGTYSNKARKAMSVVGKYCVVDSELTVKLMDKLQTFIGLTEMSTVCCVQPFTLYTQGQQIKVYSQVYKYCYDKNILVEKDGYICKDDERYTGAHVFPPVPGLYNKVVPFDFASLYPTTMIAYNIDYSTYVTDDSIPDSKCHVMSWSEHNSCIHDPKIIRKNELTAYIDEEKKKITKLREKRDDKKNKLIKQKIIDELNQKVEELKPYIQERSKIVKTISKHIMCASRYYRFLKEPKGVIPTILQNLLDARKNTRKLIKINKDIIKNSTDENEKANLIMLNNILDKRQLSYKVSCNSQYGAMGVKRGYLPFMVGAMCLSGDSLISFSYGFTRKMKDLTNTDYLWTYNENGQVVSNGKGLIYNGKKELIKITLIDGRILRCTPDHKIMTTNGWVEAGKLLSKHKWDGGEYSKVITGLELPEDIIGEDEKNWKFLDYTMDTPDNRDKTLAFCRILGFIFSDNNKLFSKVIIETLFDSEIFAQDIKLLTGYQPIIHNSNNTFIIHIPKILVDKIISLIGYQPYTLPIFLSENNCPLSVTREFLGGLFGRNCSLSQFSLRLITLEKHKDNMENTMNKLIYLLSRFGINFVLSELKFLRIDEIPYSEYTITTENYYLLLFANKIGFRYCIDKNNKLTISSSYQRYLNNEFNKNKLNFLEYKKLVGSENLLHKYQCLYLDVIDIRYDGLDDVYDIIDVPNHSFLANGIVVHNCTTYMGRVNIEVVAKTIPEKYGGELVYGDQLVSVI